VVGQHGRRSGCFRERAEGTLRDLPDTGCTPSSQALEAVRAAGGHEPKDVRIWAVSNGVQLSGRGRIPASVIKQYKAANA
jgi:hypothetical protein